ncbi:hypothetical protein ACFXKC_12845 [Streptomyces sp. NPDC059340]|uniref:hypothetical protein n=1 Tax=Streptomyces sp. NPDC059340 TaxID=3346806 RepID=UPI0036A0685D
MAGSRSRGRTGSGTLTARDAPRPTAPQVRVAIVAAATSAPPHPEASWSHRTIATQVAGTVFATISASQADWILADLELKPGTPLKAA